MKIKIRRKAQGCLSCVDLSHDLLRNEEKIRLKDEPVFLNEMEVPEGARRMEMEIKGMFIKVRFF